MLAQHPRMQHYSKGIDRLTAPKPLEPRNLHLDIPFVDPLSLLDNISTFKRWTILKTVCQNHLFPGVGPSSHQVP